MAGKFLSIEEAAAHLGKSPEEVRQLVERRQLSALRDTAGPKFRIEELDRYREEAAEEAAAHNSEGPDGVHAEISGTAGSADAAKEESGLSLDGLELDLNDSAEASLQIEEPATESSSQPVTGKTDKAPIGGSDDELAMASGIELDDLQLGSDSVESGGQQAAAADEVSLVLGVDLEETSNQDAFTNTGSDDSLVIDAGEQADARPTTAGEDQASLVIGDDIEEAPADGPQTIVGASDSLVIGDDEPAAVKPTSTSDDPASLVLGDDLDESPAGGPQTLVGADDSLASGIEDSGPAKSENIAEAASLVAGDDIELSGLDMSLAGSLSGIELGDSDPAGGQAAGGSAVQGGSIGGSFGSDIDLESLVASSAIASDAKAKQSAVEDSLAGSDLFADDISVAEPEGAEGSGILVDSGAGSGASDVGSAISGGSGVFIDGSHVGAVDHDGRLWIGGRIGHGELAAADVELAVRLESHGAKVGVEQVAGVDFALGHLRAILVRRADDRARLDARAAERDGPGLAPVIAAVTFVDSRRAAEFGKNDDQRALQHAAIRQVGHQRGEGFVEFAELLEVKVEVLVVGVVVRMRNLHERNAVLQQPASHQCVLAEIVRAVLFVFFGRLFRNVEHVAAFHQLASLFVALRVDVGLGRAALRRATAYANERVVFDRPIGQNQGIQHPLAQSWAELESTNLMAFRAAQLYDRGEECGPEANAAKYLAGEAAFNACNNAVMTHGGMGYAKEYHVERYLREAIIHRLAPISPHLVLCYIAEKVLGLPKSY